MRDFSVLKKVTGIRSGGKKQHLMAITNEKGDTVSDRKEIADVFATFYGCTAPNVRGTQEEDGLKWSASKLRR